jgi:hypothetical protein
MKKINYNIEDFNIISNYTFPINIFIDVIFGDDWNVFDLLQFAMFDNDF